LERRGLLGQVAKNIKNADLAQAKANAQRIAQSLRTDARRLAPAVRTSLGFRTGR
jgi:hypothetical protein